MPMLWLGYCGMPRRVLDYPASLGGWHAISSAGHLLSVLAILSFFIMIYDSIRQGKPSIRNNFGVGRLNTRISFYLFEANGLSFIQNKSFYTVRFNRMFNAINKSSNKDFLLYLTSIDTTLFSYIFYKNQSK
jgi:heme/copper-type cytochrome/quinol oxidase subunit 1